MKKSCWKWLHSAGPMSVDVASQLSYTSTGGCLLWKSAIFDAVQNPLGIEEEGFEDAPVTCSRQCSGSKPVVHAVCWGRPPVQLATCDPVQNPIGIKEQELEDLPSPGTDKRRFSDPILRRWGWRWSFVEFVTPDTIQGTVWVEKQVLKIGPAPSSDLFSCSESVVTCIFRRMSLVEFTSIHDSKEILTGVPGAKRIKTTNYTQKIRINLALLFSSEN